MLQKTRSWHSPHYFMANRGGKDGSSGRFSLLGLENHCWWWLQPWNRNIFAPWQESYDKPRQCVEKQRHYSIGKGLYSQGCGLLRGYVWLWELDCKEGWAPKNWSLQTVVLEETPESPLDCTRPNKSILREINPEYSLEGLLLKLKLQRLKAEGEEGVRGWDGWMAPPTQWTWTWANFGRWWVTGKPGMLQSLGVAKSQTWLGS